MKYEKHKDYIKNIETGACIPYCNGNRDFQDFEDYVKKGGKFIDATMDDENAELEKRVEQKKANVLGKIRNIELAQARTVRELMLDPTDKEKVERLKIYDDKIAELRKELKSISGVSGKL